MDEYIKREEAIEAVKHAWAKGLEPSQYIEIIPAADVEPVKRGHNIYPKSSRFECSLCGYEDWDTITCTPELHNFCPNCGARMNQEEEHGN